MRYKILKTFKGSQDGRFSETFEQGAEYELSDYLISCIPADWVKKFEIETLEDKGPALEQQAITHKRKLK